MLMRLNQRKKELRRLNTLGTKPHDNWIIFLQETHSSNDKLSKWRDDFQG